MCSEHQIAMSRCAKRIPNNYRCNMNLYVWEIERERTSLLIQCSTGNHFVCESCRVQMKRNCPVCRTSKLFHNQFLEKYWGGIDRDTWSVSLGAKSGKCYYDSSWVVIDFQIIRNQLISSALSSNQDIPGGRSRSPKKWNSNTKSKGMRGCQLLKRANILIFTSKLFGQLHRQGLLLSGTNSFSVYHTPPMLLEYLSRLVRYWLWLMIA